MIHSTGEKKCLGLEFQASARIGLGDLYLHPAGWYGLPGSFVLVLLVAVQYIRRNYRKPTVVDVNVNVARGHRASLHERHYRHPNNNTIPL